MATNDVEAADDSDDEQYVNGGSSHYLHLRRPDQVNLQQTKRYTESQGSEDDQYVGDLHYMPLKRQDQGMATPQTERHIEPSGAQGSEAEDDTYVNDMEIHQMNLERQDNMNIQQTERDVEHVQRQSAEKAENQFCCKKPPWWVWLIVVIGLLILAAVLAGVLVFVFQSVPRQNTPGSSNTGIPAGVNCQAIYNAGSTTSGVYTISPDGVRKITVYCEQQLDGGGWTVFQRRLNGQVDFNRNWSEYRSGFGDVAGEHWLGNDNIHLLTAAGNKKLKIEMTHPDGTLAYADYSVFMIENEIDKYRLHVSGFIRRDPPGDAMMPHDGVVFSTLDRDSDALPNDNCAHLHPGGWWFTDCFRAHLNGLYNGSDWGIAWTPWTTQTQSLLNVRMMMKTK